MSSTSDQAALNRPLPSRTPTGKKIETWLAVPFGLLEFVGYHLVVRPTRYLLSAIDRLSYRIEGTLFRKVLTYTIFRWL